MKYMFKIYHNDPGLTGSRAEQRSQLRTCLSDESLRTLIWNHGTSVPANWVGYNVGHPSPGRDLYYNGWSVECDEEELTAIVLKTGAIVAKMEVDSLENE